MCLIGMCLHLFHPGHLHQEVPAFLQDVVHADTLGLQKSVTDIDLILVAGLHIFPGSPQGTEIHVHEVGGTVDIESTCRHMMVHVVNR